MYAMAQACRVLLHKEAVAAGNVRAAAGAKNREGSDNSDGTSNPTVAAACTPKIITPPQ